MSTNKKIRKSQIAGIQAAVEAMEANKEFEVSPRDFVTAIYGQIKVAVEEKRQSFEAISDRIGSEGIAISARALRTHYNAISKVMGGDDSAAKKPTRRRQAA